MRRLGRTTASLAAFARRWEEVSRDAATAAPLTSRLQEVQGFGSNPGNLRMFAYVPERLAPQPALVVLLHGCTQTAQGYDHGGGWSTLARRYGFALLAPEQQAANNPKSCFTWFSPEDTARGSGEALSIRQMVARMLRDHPLDPARVFVTGLSAGGAMTSVMLATYPEVFAGGAILAGLPYGAAGSVQEAFESMFQGRERPARAWGDLVRGASPHRGPWPRVAVWHGTADTTVVPGNAGEILKQWQDVHGLPERPSLEDQVDGYPRRVWRGADGGTKIEAFAITGMAHGTPLAPAAEGAHGAAGPFMLDVGIASSLHIARFFGIAGEVVDATKDAPRSAAPPPPRAAPAGDVAATIARALRSAGLTR